LLLLSQHLHFQKWRLLMSSGKPSPAKNNIHPAWLAATRILLHGLERLEAQEREQAERDAA